MIIPNILHDNNITKKKKIIQFRFIYVHNYVHAVVYY